MKTKKRVKKLEENYEKLISEQEATLDKLVSLENAIISIKRKSDAFTEFGENKNTIDFKSESKNIVMTLKTYIDEEEEIEFFVSLEIIKHYVETFQHFMGASFHNIL